jgi:hypothetical protein
VSEIAERYVRLALRLGRLDEGVIDAYFGPSALADSVEAEDPPDPRDLVDEAEVLLADLDDSWLRDQVVGLRTVAGRLAGEQIAYPDEVQACYGVRPARTDRAALDAAYDDLEVLLPGPGSLWERYRAFEDSAPVPATTIEALMADVVEEARTRTRELFGLPDGESIQLEYVHDTPWLGYHEYLGDLRGKISINVDRPRSAISLLHLALHETYAGHQAERCNKEVALVRGQGLLEETVALVAAPQSVVSEGLAELAVELLLDGATGSAFESLVHDHDVELDLAHARAVQRAAEPLGWLGVDAALMLHDEHLPDPEVSGYLQEHALIDADAADRWIRFLKDPGSRSYAVCYPAGLERCRSYVADGATRFRRLLTEQVRVRDLVPPAL